MAVLEGKRPDDPSITELGRALASGDIFLVWATVSGNERFYYISPDRIRDYIQAQGLKYVVLVESPDGTRVDFTIPSTIAPSGDWIPQLEGQNFHPDDFTWNPGTRTFTFDTAPATGSHLTAFGYGQNV